MYSTVSAIFGHTLKAVISDIFIEKSCLDSRFEPSPCDVDGRHENNLLHYHAANRSVCRGSMCNAPLLLTLPLSKKEQLLLSDWNMPDSFDVFFFSFLVYAHPPHHFYNFSLRH